MSTSARSGVDYCEVLVVWSHRAYVNGLKRLRHIVVFDPFLEQCEDPRTNHVLGRNTLQHSLRLCTLSLSKFKAKQIATKWVGTTKFRCTNGLSFVTAPSGLSTNASDDLIQPQQRPES